MRHFRNFSLLEVLIAMMLVTISLPLMLTPFFYASIGLVENVKTLNQEKILMMIVTSILTELKAGIVPLATIEENKEFKFKENWQIKGNYRFKKISRNNEGKPELWQLRITFDEAPLIKEHLFKFIIRRKVNETVNS